MQITAQMVQPVEGADRPRDDGVQEALVEADATSTAPAMFCAPRVRLARRSAPAARPPKAVVEVAETDAAVALIELNSESDFVARNEAFRALATDIANAAVNSAVVEPNALLAANPALQQKLDGALTALREKHPVPPRRPVRAVT